VTLTAEARTLLGDLGYDPTYGARPLRRVIQKQLTDRLALALLQGELRDGDSVHRRRRRRGASVGAGTSGDGLGQVELRTAERIRPAVLKRR